MKRAKKAGRSLSKELTSKISAWLKSKKKDYAQGLALLLQSSKSGRIPRDLTRNPDSFRNLDKMNYLLAKTVGAEYEPIPDPTMPDLEKLKKEKAQKAAKEAAMQRVQEGRANEADLQLMQADSKQDQKDWPAEVKEASAALEALKKERAEKSDALADSDADNEADLVNQVKALDKSMQAKVSFLAKYMATGKVPETFQAPAPDPKTDDKPADDSQLTKDIRNLQSKASKVRTALKKNPENQEKLAELKKLETEIQLLQDQKTLSNS